MRKRLFLFGLLLAMWPALSVAAATIVGVVVNGNSGSPLAGAYVTLGADGERATTNFNGQFRIDAPNNADAYLVVVCDGYQSAGIDVTVGAGTVNVGEIRLTPDNASDDF